jgi:phage shock protein C
MESSRRFVRSPDNRILGGVCAGIGNYLRISPTLIRILWVVLTIFTRFWFMVLLYIVLWALMPKESDPMTIDADYRIRE